MEQQDYDMIKVYYPQCFDDKGNYLEEVTRSLFDYTPAQMAIMCYKLRLQETDYLALKFIECYITPEDYEPDRQLRQEYRERINELELEEGL